MISTILDYLKYNKWVIALAAMVVASVFASIGFGQYAYFFAMLIVAGYCFWKRTYSEVLFIGLLLWILLSMLLNNVYPIQYVYFVLMALCATPVFSSYKAFVLRGRLLYALCIILPVVTVINLYAYQVGINYYIQIMTLEKVAAYNFSGYMHHPMWLAAVNGMANVVLLYLFYKLKDSYLWAKVAIIALLVLSLYLSVVAASRAALAASLLAMAVMVYFQSKTSGKLVRSVLVVGLFAYIFVPFITSNSSAMQTKIDAEERGEGSSRDLTWSYRINEIKESPVWGVGFATGRDTDGWLRTGSIETGNGWLAILSQTGLVGGLIVLMMLFRAYVPVDEIKEEGGVLILFGCIFIYLCAHSIFEGYLFTAGYCPCLFFWLTLSFFYEYKKYGYPEEIEDSSLIYEYDEDYDDEEDDDDDEE